MAPPAPATICLIDDEPSFVRALARLLQRDGYHVDTAANGAQALAQLQAQPYDVILCDLQMPGLDGTALYTRLRQQAPALCQRMIFLTGDTLGGASTAFLTQCSQPCLYKPCTAAEVRGLIPAGAGRRRGPQRRLVTSRRPPRCLCPLVERRWDPRVHFPLEGLSRPGA